MVHVTICETETGRAATGANRTYCLQAWQGEGEGQGDGESGELQDDDASQQESTCGSEQQTGSAGGHHQTERSQNQRDLNQKVRSPP